MGLSCYDQRAGAMKFRLTHVNIARFANERGVALIVVLWIFIFLFVVAFDFSTSVREEAAAANRYGDETQGYYLAIGGFGSDTYRFGRGDGGLARDVPEQRHLTEEPARSLRGQVPPVPGDVEPPRRDEIEAIAGLAFPDQDG